ncbi:hypothetical protein GGQ13_003032 [Salinibacter ruber]|nr:hypothetical protein [Salinibacter ruber]
MQGESFRGFSPLGRTISETGGAKPEGSLSDRTWDAPDVSPPARFAIGCAIARALVSDAKDGADGLDVGDTTTATQLTPGFLGQRRDKSITASLDITLYEAGDL